MSRIRADRYTNRLGTGAPVFSNGVNITGNVGVGTTVPTSKLTVVGNMNVTGTVSVGGTLSYEDVTDIDSVGVITARSGIHVTGGSVGIGTDNPGGALQVGSSNASHVIITQNTGIDINDGAINLYQATSNVNAVPFLISTDVGGTETEKVRVTGEGKVGISTDMTNQNVMLSIFSDGTATRKAATLYQNTLTGTGQGKGFYVGSNHNDKVGYVWNYEADALSFATNNVQRARIDSDGYMTVAPSGMVIRSGFYDAGVGAAARTATTSSTFTTLNINGTGQVGHNIGKISDDVLSYTKVSSNSHLQITISLPFYLSNGATGWGIRGLLSTNDGSNYYTISGLTDGPAHKWGAGGYGGNTSGVFNYTWNTRMNSSQASTILAKTGTIRFYFEVCTWSSTDELTAGFYTAYDKKTSITVQEIAE